MKIFKYLCVLLIVVSLSGCGQECVPQPPVVKIVYKTKKMYVEVPCKVDQDAIARDCDFDGKGFEPTVKLLQCIVSQKRALEACEGKKENNSSI